MPLNYLTTDPQFLRWAEESGHDALPNWVLERMHEAWAAARVRTDPVADIEKINAICNTKDIVEEMDDDLLRQFYEFRVRFLLEELHELDSAGSPEEAVDALIDLVVVAIGTLLAFGVDVRKAWRVAQEANERKVPGSNSRRPNPFGLPDLVKPPGWTAPDHTGNVGLLDKVFERKAVHELGGG